MQVAMERNTHGVQVTRIRSWQAAKCMQAGSSQGHESEWNKTWLFCVISKFICESRNLILDNVINLWFLDGSRITCEWVKISEIFVSICEFFVSFYVSQTHKKTHKKLTYFISPSLEVSCHQNFTNFFLTTNEYFDGAWTNFTNKTHVFATSDLKQEK